MKALTDHSGKPSLTRIMAAACIAAAIVQAIIWQVNIFEVANLPTNTDTTTKQIIQTLLFFGFGGKVTGAAVEKWQGLKE